MSKRGSKHRPKISMLNKIFGKYFTVFNFFADRAANLHQTFFIALNRNFYKIVRISKKFIRISRLFVAYSVSVVCFLLFVYLFVYLFVFGLFVCIFIVCLYFYCYYYFCVISLCFYVFSLIYLTMGW